MSQEDLLLGKNIGYPKAYCREILVAIPRQLNREAYGIKATSNLFCGYDSWHVYEAGFITRKGLPVIGVLKIVYASTSECIVESKSLKLYLASFNMTPLGENTEEGIRLFSDCIKADLSELLDTPVEVRFYTNVPSVQPFDFSDYTLLEALPQVTDESFSIYQEHPEYVTENITAASGELWVCSHLLKSNCRVTRQPDWGSIYIRIKANRLPDKISLLKYIVSLRDENHFHEEICEMTFKRLTDAFHPEILMVCCLYTRRGGIDICPVRTNHKKHLPFNLPQADVLTQRTFRQ